MSEDLYWRLHTLSKMLESSGRIDELDHPDAYPTILDAMNALRPALEQPKAEPTGWVQLGLLNGKSYLRMVYDRTPYPPPPDVVRNLNLVPVYEHPPEQRKPLTDAQVSDVLGFDPDPERIVDQQYVEIIRAVERAHGIGDKP